MRIDEQSRIALTTLLAFVLVLVSLASVGIGLVLLAYNGYAEDAGDEPGHTLWLAIPWLASAAWMLLLSGGALVSGDPGRVRKLKISIGIGVAQAAFLGLAYLLDQLV